MNTFANVGKPFSARDDQLILEMHAERASVREIARKLERTEAGVTARLERLGLRPSVVLRRQRAMGIA